MHLHKHLPTLCLALQDRYRLIDKEIAKPRAAEMDFYRRHPNPMCAQQFSAALQQIPHPCITLHWLLKHRHSL
jgi:hypothetical protein